MRPFVSPSSAAASWGRRWSACSPRPGPTSPRGSVGRWSWSASGCAGWPQPGRLGHRRGPVHHRLNELVTRADLVVEVIGGIEPARSLIPRAMASTAPRSSRPTRRCSPRTDRPCMPPRRSTASTSTTRRPSRAPYRCFVRSVSRSPATPSAGSSASSTGRPTTSRQDGLPGAGFSEAVEQAQALGYAEADPTAGRRGFRRRRQGRHPRPVGLPHPGARQRRPPRGHHRGQRHRRPVRQGHGLCGQAPRHL